MVLNARAFHFSDSWETGIILDFTGEPTQIDSGLSEDKVSEWRIRDPGAHTLTPKSFNTGQAKLRHVPVKMTTLLCVSNTGKGPEDLNTPYHPLIIQLPCESRALLQCHFPSAQKCSNH